MLAREQQEMADRFRQMQAQQQAPSQTGSQQPIQEMSAQQYHEMQQQHMQKREITPQQNAQHQRANNMQSIGNSIVGQTSTRTQRISLANGKSRLFGCDGAEEELDKGRL